MQPVGAETALEILGALGSSRPSPPLARSAALRRRAAIASTEPRPRRGQKAPSQRRRRHGEMPKASRRGHETPVRLCPPQPCTSTGTLRSVPTHLENSRRPSRGGPALCPGRSRSLTAGSTPVSCRSTGGGPGKRPERRPATGATRCRVAAPGGPTGRGTVPFSGRPQIRHETHVGGACDPVNVPGGAPLRKTTRNGPLGRTAPRTRPRRAGCRSRRLLARQLCPCLRSRGAVYGLASSRTVLVSR
jgi:hypothetical protein